MVRRLTHIPDCEGSIPTSSQGHSLYKLQNISLEEVKIVSFQQ